MQLTSQECHEVWVTEAWRTESKFPLRTSLYLISKELQEKSVALGSSLNMTLCSLANLISGCQVDHYIPQLLHFTSLGFILLSDHYLILHGLTACLAQLSFTEYTCTMSTCWRHHFKWNNRPEGHDSCPVRLKDMHNNKPSDYTAQVAVGRAGVAEMHGW